MSNVANGPEAMSFRKLTGKNKEDDSAEKRSLKSGDCYFVLYETGSVTNSFLVFDVESTSEAWHAAVDYVEENHAHETPIITKFLKV